MREKASLASPHSTRRARNHRRAILLTVEKYCEDKCNEHTNEQSADSEIRIGEQSC